MKKQFDKTELSYVEKEFIHTAFAQDKLLKYNSFNMKHAVNWLALTFTLIGASMVEIFHILLK